MCWGSSPGFSSALNRLRSVLSRKKTQNELSTESQDRLASPSGSGHGAEEWGTGTAGFEEPRGLRREIEDLRRQVESQTAEMAKLRGGEDELAKECEDRGYKIAELERENGKMRSLHQEEVRKRTQHAQAMEDRLKRTQELLATRSAELAGAQAFLSTTDHLSEAEVLGIVRDLNENIYQVAVKLTEEWEGLESPQDISPMDVDPTSHPRVPILVRLVRNRDPMGLTFLLQSNLCFQVVEMTSKWGYHQELAALDSVYQRLSASGKCHIV